MDLCGGRQSQSGRSSTYSAAGDERAADCHERAEDDQRSGPRVAVIRGRNMARASTVDRPEEERAGGQEAVITFLRRSPSAFSSQCHVMFFLLFGEWGRSWELKGRES